MKVEDRNFLLHNPSQAVITSNDPQPQIVEQSLDLDNSGLSPINPLLSMSGGQPHFHSISRLLLIRFNFLSALSVFDDPGTIPSCRLIMLYADPTQSVLHEINLVL